MIVCLSSLGGKGRDREIASPIDRRAFTIARMDWTLFRQEFPVTRRWAYFDHAAVAPPSASARAVLVEWVDDMAANGVAVWANWQRRVDETRKRAGRLLNTDPKNIAFIKNTSEGISFVAEGLPWRAGDNVVTAADEYPSNLYPWMNLVDRGVEVRRVASKDGRILIDDLRAALDARTRLVTLSYVEYATGFRNDLDAICSLCRERGVLFFVDAIQGLGAFPLDVRKTPIDFLAADGHKWLLGPEGAGIFFVRPELVEQMHTVEVGWQSVIHDHDFSRIELVLKPHAGRWESGTLNYGGIVALGASLELLLSAGADAIAARLLELTDHLCEQAKRAGFGVYSSRRTGEASGIVSLTGIGDPAAAVRQCRAAGVIVNQRAGRLRVSPHVYNTLEEIDHLVNVLGAPA
jgi:cysteine desulfurase / selenocysteine lyase